MVPFHCLVLVATSTEFVPFIGHDATSEQAANYARFPRAIIILDEQRATGLGRSRTISRAPCQSSLQQVGSISRSTGYERFPGAAGREHQAWVEESVTKKSIPGVATNLPRTIFWVHV